MFYHHVKANVVVDALCRLFMDSIAHIKEEKKEVAKDIQRLAHLGILLMSISHDVVIIQIGRNLHW